jgi:hypothetical protein
MLNDLIGRVEQTQLPEKDPEAEQLLNQRLARNPNALYILSQTVLVQKYALEQAKSQIDQLRQLQQASYVPSAARPRYQLSRQPAGSPRSGSAPSPAPAPPSADLCPAAIRTGLESCPLVRGTAATWRDLELFAHRRDHCGRSRGRGSGISGHRIVDAWLWSSRRFRGGGYFGGGAPEETVINNYYDDAGRQSGAESHGEHLDNSGLGDSGNDAASLHQASDNLRDGSDDTDDQDDLSLDDASYDDSSLDDSDSDDSSYDDSSSDGGNDLA